MFYPFARRLSLREVWVHVGSATVYLARRHWRDGLDPVRVWRPSPEPGGTVILLGTSAPGGEDMRRPEVSKGKEHSLAEIDKVSFAEWPSLRSFFLSTVYEGTDAEREPGLLMLSAGIGGWQATLKDPTAMTQLRVNASSWDELQLLLDSLLADPKAPWVPDLFARQRRSGRRR